MDEGEECDCGYIGDNSCRMDVCCIGRNANSGCKLRPGKICRFISIHCSLCLFFVTYTALYTRKNRRHERRVVIVFCYRDRSVLLKTNTFVESINHYIRAPGGVFFVCYSHEWYIMK